MGMNYIPLRTYQLVSWISSINREWIRSLAFLGCFTRLFSCFGSGTPGHYVETSWKKRKVPCSVVSRAHTNSCPFFFVGSNNKNLPDFLEYELFFIFRLCSFICVLGDFPKIFPKIPKVRKLGCLVIPGTFSCLECAGNGTSTLPKSWKVQRTQELECWKDLPGGTKEVLVSLRFEGSESGKNQHFENCE